MRELQQQIISALKVQLQIDPETEIRRSVDFLKAYLQKTGLKTLVLGISGGQGFNFGGQLSEMAVTELREEVKE